VTTVGLYPYWPDSQLSCQNLVPRRRGRSTPTRPRRLTPRRPHSLALRRRQRRRRRFSLPHSLALRRPHSLALLALPRICGVIGGRLQRLA
jgi:hypothetical protein